MLGNSLKFEDKIFCEMTCDVSLCEGLIDISTLPLVYANLSPAIPLNNLYGDIKNSDDKAKKLDKLTNIFKEKEKLCL